MDTKKSSVLKKPDEDDIKKSEKKVAFEIQEKGLFN